MNFCLDCQACETACPAGVKYGSMVEAARVEIERAGFASSPKERIKKFILNKIFTSKKRFKFLFRMIYFYQKSGLQKLLHSSGLFKAFFPQLSEMDKLSPLIPRQFSDEIIPEFSLPAGEIKYKTAFLSGCLMNVMFADINKDTFDVLTACGCSVYTPKGQVCCGSLNAHNGELESAIKLARHTIDTFLQTPDLSAGLSTETSVKVEASAKADNQPTFDYLVTNSAGCSAFMKEYVHLFKDDPVYAEKAKIFSSKVKDFSEFLYELKIYLKLNEVNKSVTYHDACHLAHTQKITVGPREIIKSIPGINYKELEESSWCCGSAGIYNLMQYESSMIILKRKMENIKKTNSDIVVAGNPGCISQLKYGAEKFNVNVEVLHPATLVKRALN